MLYDEVECRAWRGEEGMEAKTRLPNGPRISAASIHDSTTVVPRSTHTLSHDMVSSHSKCLLAIMISNYT